MSAKKKEGHPLKETTDMKAWKEEFDEMDLVAHEEKLRKFGLDDEDVADFKEDFSPKKKEKK